MAALAVAIALWRARCSPTAAPSSEPVSKSWLCCEVFAAFAGCERRLRMLIFPFFVDRFLCRSHIQTNLCEVMSLLTRMRVESCLLTKQHTVHLADIVSLRQVWKSPRRLRRSDSLILICRGICLQRMLRQWQWRQVAPFPNHVPPRIDRFAVPPRS